MRLALAALALTALTACGPRQVEVQTAPTQSAETAIHFTNNLSSAVNVYVNSGGSDLFVRQVPANSTEHLPVPGISSGSSVTLKATVVGSNTTYSKNNVIMSQTVTWRVP
jgi:hypothetical protein